MKLIKAAMTYKATIPTDANTLATHLAEKAFSECIPSQIRSVGFVNPSDEGTGLVQTFPGGLAFRVRIDEKIIPAGTVRDEVEKQVNIIKATTGRKPGKKERAEIKDVVLHELCQRALVRTKASVTCFYDIANGYLIVPTASKPVADICTSLLVQAVGSVKTETINVSGVKHGLTTRLRQWLNEDDDAFGAFQPCDDVALAAEGRKITVKMSSLQLARRGLDEAMAVGFEVNSIGFHFAGMDFCLTSDFNLKGIKFLEHEIPEEEESIWAADAAMQVKMVSSVINELAALLSYKDEVKEAA